MIFVLKIVLFINNWTCLLTKWRHQILESRLVGWRDGSVLPAHNHQNYRPGDWTSIGIRFAHDLRTHMQANIHMYKIDFIFLYFNKRKILWLLVWVSVTLGEKLFSRVISLTQSTSSSPSDPLQLPESSGSSYDSIYINKFWMFCWNIQAAGGTEFLK